MKPLSRIFSLLLLLGLPLAAADEVDFSAVQRADDERVAATVAADRTRLDAVYSDDFTYAHSTGKVDTKASFMEALLSGKEHYLSCSYERRTFTAAGPGIVLMKGRCRIRAGGADGKAVENYLGFLGVWRKENGAWRFLAWQSCHIVEGT